MDHHDSDLYKSNILLLDKSPFIVTKIYANNYHILFKNDTSNEFYLLFY